MNYWVKPIIIVTCIIIALRLTRKEVMEQMRHRYLIDREYLQVYLCGEFCLVEIDVPGRAFQLFTKTKGKFNTFKTLNDE